MQPYKSDSTYSFVSPKEWTWVRSCPLLVILLVFLLKTRAKRNSYDQPFLGYISSSFRRFSAVLVSYVILWLSELKNYLEILSFWLKWRLKKVVHTTSCSQDINSAVFRRFQRKRVLPSPITTQGRVQNLKINQKSWSRKFEGRGLLKIHKFWIFREYIGILLDI